MFLNPLCFLNPGLYGSFSSVRSKCSSHLSFLLIFLSFRHVHKTWRALLVSSTTFAPSPSPIHPLPLFFCPIVLGIIIVCNSNKVGITVHAILKIVLGNHTKKNGSRSSLCPLPSGVVHAYVGQKLLKPYILRVFRLTNYELFHATFF